MSAGRPDTAAKTPQALTRALLHTANERAHAAHSPRPDLHLAAALGGRVNSHGRGVEHDLRCLEGKEQTKIENPYLGKRVGHRSLNRRWPRGTPLRFCVDRGRDMMPLERHIKQGPLRFRQVDAGGYEWQLADFSLSTVALVATQSRYADRFRVHALSATADRTVRSDSSLHDGAPIWCGLVGETPGESACGCPCASCG